MVLLRPGLPPGGGLQAEGQQAQKGLLWWAWRGQGEPDVVWPAGDLSVEPTGMPGVGQGVICSE